MSPDSPLDDVEALRAIEDVCTRFENADPSERDIEVFCQGFSGEQRTALLRELIGLDMELRRRAGQSCQLSDYTGFTELNRSLLEAVPSTFLNTNFQNLVDDSAKPTSPRYQVGELIGSGGIGDVYRVDDTFGQRPLALKTLKRQFQAHQSAIDRFHREGLLTGTLQHPGIPPVYDHGTLEDGTPFFSMKLVEGQTLQQILKSRQAQRDDLGDLIGIFENVSQTIAYAHSQGVIHRDLKPHNIMVGRFGEIQVMDWGLAKRLGGDSESDQDVATEPTRSAVETDRSAVTQDPSSGETPHGSDLTTAGDIVGTPGYMAPEQARGDVDCIDARVDVFGLGAILFQILTGQTLFQGVSRDETIERTRRGELVDAMRHLDQLRGDDTLILLCRRCLNPDPAGRPVDAAEVAGVTQDYLAGLQHRIRQAEIERSRSEVRMIESRKRQRWIVGLTGALAAVAILSSVIVSDQWIKAKRAAAAESMARDIAEQEAEATTEVNEFLDEILTSSLPERLGHDVTLREVIDHALPVLDGKFTGRPHVEGSIRRTLGESYRWLGEPDIAERQYRLALAAFEDANSYNELEVLETKDRLAGVLRSRGDEGDFAESKRLRTEVLTRTRELLGESHERTIAAMNNLGTVLIEMNELDQAAELFRAALRQIDASPHPEQYSRPALLVNLADVDRMKGQWDSAEAIYLDVLGDPQASTYESDLAMIQLGQMFQSAERYDASLHYLRQSFEVREQYYGPRHPLTLSAMRKMSRVMDEAERYDELLELLGESLDRHAQEYLPAAGPICEARSLMAKALIGLGRVEEAEQYLEETIELISSERGAKHKYALAAKKQLDALRTAD
ncbi:Serine/threonine-protein kinase PknD [Stieleria neptunia]|uniref:Serine/threonine-protein kinase PknD n=1 Tax=Stieleria neptunia TaxID=2527979 RepID=A0A518I281_9BACT|nr:serine/threonine-protein kinase [Stieleria neptunia]QDV47222.1 Serine/threonine-protein kinase PknD [Stieleria neptunia]